MIGDVPIRRFNTPIEKQVTREGCIVATEVCEVVPRRLVQKVAEYRLFVWDFVANILGYDPTTVEEVLIEDCCAMPRTVEFDPRAISNKIFNSGSIKLGGTAVVTLTNGDKRQIAFFLRAVFQEIEPVPGVRDTDQVLEQLEFVEGCDVAVVQTTDPQTGLEADLIIFKASLVVEKRIFRCMSEVPPCPPNDDMSGVLSP